MNSKLTLTVDETVIKKAKRYAKEQKSSLSNIIENYLKILTRNQIDTEESTPIIDALRGSFKLPNNFNYREELDKRLVEKYLK